METRNTTFWTFFCNPLKWQIDAFLASGRDQDFYQITKWQKDWFTPGQLGVVRVGTDRRTKAQLGNKPRLVPGVYAMVDVLGPPQWQKPGDPFWLDPPADAGERLAVPVRYLKALLREPLLLSDLKADSRVTDRYLLGGFEAASMPLDPGTFDRLHELAGSGPFDTAAADVPPVGSADVLVELERRYADASPQVKEAVSRRIERGPVAAAVKAANGYRCLICLAIGRDPVSFLTRDGRPYVEAHHVTFVSDLKPGTLGPSNVITVCANHHRQLHYGDAVLVRADDAGFVFRIDGVEVLVPRGC